MAKKQKPKTPAKRAGVYKAKRNEKNKTKSNSNRKTNKPNNLRAFNFEDFEKEFNKGFKAGKQAQTKPTKNAGQVKGAAKVIKAQPVKINKSAVASLRKLVRKKDGTYFSKDYYEKLAKKIAGKKQDEVDDVLINLRNKNPNVRYFIESKGDTLFFQTGNFVDRLAGKSETTKVGRKGKKTNEVKLTGKIKKGTKVIVIDLHGDEHEFSSIVEANKVLYRQNNIINRTIEKMLGKDNIDKRKRGKKKKSIPSGLVTVSETVTSNSEKEVVSIKYDFTNIKAQGIDQKKFDYYLNDELENGDEDGLQE
jgi:hypothetical protein